MTEKSLRRHHRRRGKKTKQRHVEKYGNRRTKLTPVSDLVYMEGGINPVQSLWWWGQ
ncbi:MAG: hypothetical protein IPG79_16480 [Saprospiraceae bacterium]|nr:hypothetical protein [Saprospiraceae bacterium]